MNSILWLGSLLGAASITVFGGNESLKYIFVGIFIASFINLLIEPKRKEWLVYDD